MSKKNKTEFDNIVFDIVNNEEFNELDNELHHGITRYMHSMRVARATYSCTKKLKMDYISATRAALMHDFYSDKEFDNEKPKDKLKMHPELAVANAKKYYEISPMEENVIASHMFPLGTTRPKYKESWIVTLMDKTVALYEMYRFKFGLVISVWLLFIFNMIALQK